MSKPKSLYYTDRHIRIFIDMFSNLVDLFGLSDYSVSFEVVENTKFGARIEYNVDKRYAVVYINKRMRAPSSSEETSEIQMRKAAAHEFAHLLTADLYIAGRDKNFTAVDLDRYSEAVSRRFEFASGLLHKLFEGERNG